MKKPKDDIRKKRASEREEIGLAIGAVGEQAERGEVVGWVVKRRGGEGRCLYTGRARGVGIGFFFSFSGKRQGSCWSLGQPLACRRLQRSSKSWSTCNCCGRSTNYKAFGPSLSPTCICFISLLLLPFACLNQLHGNN